MHQLEVSRQLHAPAALSPGKEPNVVTGVEDWVSPRTGLAGMERRKILPLQELELQPPGHPAHSQSL
jgi:hypothetical protein